MANSGPIIHPPDDNMSMESHVGMILTGKPKNWEKKFVTQPFCPPQIPHGLTLV
jgi:hypothetical protein